METEIQAILFSLGPVTCGISVKDVETIERLMPLSRLPFPSAFIQGLATYKGRVLPVMSLSGRLGIAESKFTDDTRIVVVSANGKQIGLIVDSTDEVVSTSSRNVQPQTEPLHGIDPKYIQGVVRPGPNREFIWLDLSTVLDLRELTAMLDSNWINPHQAPPN